MRETLCEIQANSGKGVVRRVAEVLLMATEREARIKRLVLFVFVYLVRPLDRLV